MLSAIEHPPPLGEVGVHAGVIHEVFDENVEATEIGCFRRDHLKHRLLEILLLIVQRL